jgi:hypothetical protein
MGHASFSETGTHLKERQDRRYSYGLSQTGLHQEHSRAGRAVRIVQ